MTKVLMILTLQSSPPDMELVWFDTLPMCIDYAQQINKVPGFSAMCFAPGTKEG